MQLQKKNYASDTYTCSLVRDTPTSLSRGRRARKSDQIEGNDGAGASAIRCRSLRNELLSPSSVTDATPVVY